MTPSECLQGQEYKRKLMHTQIKHDYEMSKTDRLITTAFITGLIVGWVIGLITLAMVI